MADDTTKTNPQDSKRINIKEDHEVRYWCKELRVTPSELRSAVDQAGPMADDVRSYFKK